MEFLMTYGWAILVVLAAIGALAATGVLDMGNLAPDKTTFPTPMLNTESAVVTYEGEDNITVQVPLANNFGKTVNISEDGITGSGDCQETPTLTVSPDTKVPNNEEFILTWYCDNPSGLSSGDKFKADLGFQYESSSSGMERPHSGSVIAKVQ